MVESVDSLDSGSSVHYVRVRSSRISRTTEEQLFLQITVLFLYPDAIQNQDFFGNYSENIHQYALIFGGMLDGTERN